MSSSQTDSEHDRGMMKVMGMVLISLCLLSLFIVVTARLLGIDSDEGSDDPLMRQALVSRLQPVGAVRTSLEGMEVASAESAGGGAARSGEELVNGVCAGCHVGGVGGAPVIGDDAAWATRREAGLDMLVASVVNGKGSMPARGGSDYSDEEIRIAVEHMAGFEPSEESAPAADAPAEEASGAEATAEEASGDEAPAEDAAVEEGAGDEASAEEGAEEAAGGEATEDATGDAAGDGGGDETAADDAAESGADAAGDEQSEDAAAGEPDAAEGAAEAEAEPASDDAAEADAAADDTDAASDATEVAAADESTDSASTDTAAAGAGDEVDLMALIASGTVPDGLSDQTKAAVDGVCAGCHIAGVAEAPKIGDKEAWAARAELGLAALTQSVMKGKGIMPARGGSQLTDEEIPLAIQYLLAKQ